jgi:hypothetical protein
VTFLCRCQVYFSILLLFRLTSKSKKNFFLRSFCMKLRPCEAGRKSRRKSQSNRLFSTMALSSVSFCKIVSKVFFKTKTMCYLRKVLYNSAITVDFTASSNALRKCESQKSQSSHLSPDRLDHGSQSLSASCAGNTYVQTQWIPQAAVQAKGNCSLEYLSRYCFSFSCYETTMIIVDYFLIDHP